MIVELKPAAILIELPPAIDGQPTVVKERIASRFAGTEIDAANAAADALRIAVVGYDRAGRNEFYLETKYFGREEELSRRIWP